MVEADAVGICPYLLVSPTPSTCNSLAEVLLYWQGPDCPRMWQINMQWGRSSPPPPGSPAPVAEGAGGLTSCNLALGHKFEVHVLTSFPSALVGGKLQFPQWQFGQWYKLCFWPFLSCLPSLLPSQGFLGLPPQIQHLNLSAASGCASGEPNVRQQSPSTFYYLARFRKPIKHALKQCLLCVLGACFVLRLLGAAHLAFLILIYPSWWDSVTE